MDGRYRRLGAEAASSGCAVPFLWRGGSVDRSGGSIERREVPSTWSGGSVEWRCGTVPVEGRQRRLGGEVARTGVEFTSTGGEAAPAGGELASTGGEATSTGGKAASTRGKARATCRSIADSVRRKALEAGNGTRAEVLSLGLTREILHALAARAVRRGRPRIRVRPSALGDVPEPVRRLARDLRKALANPVRSSSAPTGSWTAAAT